MPATSNDVIACHHLLDQLANARQRTDEIFSIVRPEYLYERPIAERHRIVFYIGHLEAFDWNLFHDRVLKLKSFNPDLDRLFAFGIDPVGGGLPTDQPSDWPSLAAIHDYVLRVRKILDDKLSDALADSDDRHFEGFPLSTMLNVAIEHRLMHAETLAYMFHQLPLDHKASPSRGASAVAPVSSPLQRSIEIPAGQIILGLSRSSGQFGWDNEFESHSVEVPAFSIDQFKVTNGQYLEFVEAGGYDGPSFWENPEDNNRSRNADWTWKTDHKISHPAFWKRDGNQWLYRAMFEEIPLPRDWPVYVSQAEAKAFAKWAGKSLPSEAEWQRAAYASAGSGQRSYPWGEEPPRAGLGNFDFASWNPTPVNAFPQNQSAFGVRDMLGNGWEWTSTVFSPFPGFEPFPFYRGYSADFFDGKHFVMKGGSPRTAACMLRPTFRNWFQSHYQYMYAGFRCVTRPSSGKSAEKPGKRSAT